MSLNGLFMSGRSSLRTLEAAMKTAGHNVANAGTDGFHRRQMGVSPVSIAGAGLWSRPTAGTFTGGGVQVAAYSRARDAMLEGAVWQTGGGLGAADEGVRLSAALEGVLEPEAAGSLNGALRAFWGAWGDAANAPTDVGVRRVLLRQGEALTASFRSLDGRLEQLSRDAAVGLREGVADANRLLGEIAGLNERIAKARSLGAPDLDAEDARDRAMGALSSFLPVRVAPQADGTFTVTVQGMAAVQGAETLKLEVLGPPDAPGHGVRFAGTSVQLAAGDGAGQGRLGASLHHLNHTLPGVRQQFGALATRLVADVNAAHEAGYGLDNGTGRAFFDPTLATPGTLALAVTDPAHVALAGGPGAPGDTSVGRAIADLGPAFEDEALWLSTSAGESLRRARVEAGAQGALAAHLGALVEGVSAVSIDEEMTRLIQYQQHYAASARVLVTAQAMMDTLLAL